MTVRRSRRGLTFADVARMAGTLPGVEEGTSYGTPSLHVRRKFVARLKEDGETLVPGRSFVERDHLVPADPATYYVTDHYRDDPSVRVRLPNARADEMRALVESAWRRVATKRVVEAFDA